MRALTGSWPSLARVPALYPDARNRVNRGPLLYRAGACFPLSGPLDTRGRLPLLAVGSNGYPRQLADKLRGSDADLQGAPIVPALLRGYDVAFCPVRSRKGYVPVTLAARAGGVCLSWLQWLTPEQLEIISASEGSRYSLVGGEQLAAATRISPRWRRPASVYAWWFDSLLICNDAPLWLDVYRPPHAQQRALDPDRAGQRVNPIPPGWRIAPRDPDTHAVGEAMMSEMC